MTAAVVGGQMDPAHQMDKRSMLRAAGSQIAYFPAKTPSRGRSVGRTLG
jgi:hypothetical protein